MSCTNTTPNEATTSPMATHALYYQGSPIALVTIVNKEKFHGREVNHEVDSICRIVKILDTCPAGIPFIVGYPKDKYKYVHELLPNLLVVWKTADIKEYSA
ncbi:hypothetical protein MOUN0_G03246 [Monosporozyma unispora]|nr:hypothetical protein C6P44_005068 [Kazachstania unispora]